MNSERDISIKNFERIEAYLLGTMDPADRKQFERERQDNSDFDEMVIEQSALLRSVEIGSMREQLVRIHQNQMEKKPPGRTAAFWFGIAAGAALLIASTIWWQIQPNQYQKLLASHVSIDPGLPVPMSASENKTYHFYDAMVDYKLENYEVAFSKWSALLEAKPGNDTIQFYLGLALFNQGAYDESLPYFAEVERNKESEFQYKSQWYIVLVGLARENASDILAVKPLPNSPYTGQITNIQSEFMK